MCFGDVELKPDASLLVTAMSDLRMQTLLDLLQEVAAHCLGVIHNTKGCAGPGPRAKPERERLKPLPSGSTIWRDIELAEDQTLEDLHLMIQQAYEWWDDHLYSFFLSGQAWDQASEIGSPWSDTSLHTHQVQMDQLNLQLGQTFLYYFDYGDSHEFDVTLLTINPAGAAGQYPTIVGRQGQAPPQYPDYDEETGEMEWDPYAHHIP